MRPTSAQISIAMRHDIPKRLAHTVNLERYVDYCRWRSYPEQRLERFFENMQDRHLARLRRELMIGVR